MFAALGGAALLCSLLLGTVFTALKLSGEGHTLQGWATGLVLYGAVSLFFALPIALVPGGAVYWLLGRHDRANGWTLVVAGGVLATAPFFLLGSGSGLPDEGVAGQGRLAALLFVAGCVGGAAFWALAGLGRGRIP